MYSYKTLRCHFCIHSAESIILIFIDFTKFFWLGALPKIFINSTGEMYCTYILCSKFCSKCACDAVLACGQFSFLAI